MAARILIISDTDSLEFMPDVLRELEFEWNPDSPAPSMIRVLT